MRGLERLQKLRRDGLRPQDPVRVDTDPASHEYGGWLVVDRGERPGLVDLRAFKGLAVIVSAPEFQAADEWAKAIADAGADSVAVYVADGFDLKAGPAFLKFKGEMLA